MAVDFTRTFGAGSQSNQAGSSNDRSQAPKAKIWLNIGYVAENIPTADGNGVEDRFVSLPVGIPLDTMEKLPTNSRNQAYAQFQAARNDLYDQIMAAASQLQPGEDIVIGSQVATGGLCIQVRRVNDERAEAPAVDDSNPFARQLVFN